MDNLRLLRIESNPSRNQFKISSTRLPNSNKLLKRSRKVNDFRSNKSLITMIKRARWFLMKKKRKRLFGRVIRISCPTWNTFQRLWEPQTQPWDSSENTKKEKCPKIMKFCTIKGRKSSLIAKWEFRKKRRKKWYLHTIRYPMWKMLNRRLCLMSSCMLKSSTKIRLMRWLTQDRSLKDKSKNLIRKFLGSKDTFLVTKLKSRNKRRQLKILRRRIRSTIRSTTLRTLEFVLLKMTKPTTMLKLEVSKRRRQNRRKPSNKVVVKMWAIWK